MALNPSKPKDQIEEDSLAKKLWKKESSRLLRIIDLLKIQFKLHLTELLSYFTTPVRPILSPLPPPQTVLEQNQERTLNDRIRQETPLPLSQYSESMDKDAADAKSYEEGDEARALGEREDSRSITTVSNSFINHTKRNLFKTSQIKEVTLVNDDRTCSEQRIRILKSSTTCKVIEEIMEARKLGTILVDGTSKEAELTIPTNSSTLRNETPPTQEFLQTLSTSTEAPKEVIEPQNAQINNEGKIDELTGNLSLLLNGNLSLADQHNLNAKSCFKPNRHVKQPMKFRVLKEETLNPDYDTTTTNTEDASINLQQLQKIQEINTNDATSTLDEEVRNSTTRVDRYIQFQVMDTSFYLEKSIPLHFWLYNNIISQFFNSFGSLKMKNSFKSGNWLNTDSYLSELLRLTYSKYQSYKISSDDDTLFGTWITPYIKTNRGLHFKDSSTLLQARQLTYVLDYPARTVYEIGSKRALWYSSSKGHNSATQSSLVELKQMYRFLLAFPKKSDQEIIHSIETETSCLEKLYRVSQGHYISLDADGIMTKLPKIKKFIKLLRLLGFIGLLGMLKTPESTSIVRNFLTNAASQLLVLESRTTQIFSKTKEPCKYQSFIKKREELIATFDSKNVNSRVGQHERSQITTTFFRNQSGSARISSSGSQNLLHPRFLRGENEERDEQPAQDEQIRANLSMPDGSNQEAIHEEHQFPQAEADVEPVDNTLRFNPVEENCLRLMSNRSIEGESMGVHPRDNSASGPYFNAKSAIQGHSPESPPRSNPERNLDKTHPIHSAHSLRGYSRRYIQISLMLFILMNLKQDPPPRQKSIESVRVSTLDVINIETFCMQVLYIADIRIFPTNHDHDEDAFQPNQLGAVATAVNVQFVQILNQTTRHLIVEDSGLRDMISGVIEEPVLNHNAIDGEIGEQNNSYQDTHLLEEDSMHYQIDALRHHLTQAAPHQRLNGSTEENVHFYNLFQGNYLFILGAYNLQNPERTIHSYNAQGVSYNDPNLDENPIVSHAMEIQNISNQNNPATQQYELDEYRFIYDLSSSRITVQNITQDPINVYALEYDGDEDGPNLFAPIRTNLSQTQAPRAGRVDRNLEETAPVSEIDLLANDNLDGVIDYNNGLIEAHPQNYPTHINDYSENQWDEAAISQIRSMQSISNSLLYIEETLDYLVMDNNYLEIGVLTEPVNDMYLLTMDDTNEPAIHVVELSPIAAFALTVQENPSSIEVGDIDQYAKEQSHYSITTCFGEATFSTLSSQNQ